MMTWCFAMDYLQPNTHCSGLPPHWAGHTWSELLISKVSAFLMTPGRLGGDCGIRCTFLPLHAPYTRHQALTLSLLTFTRVWVNIWAPLCVRYSEEHKYREKRAVFAGVNSLSCLARPNTSSRPCDCDSDFISKHVKCSNTFLILGIYFPKTPSLLLTWVTCPKPRTKDGCLTLYYPLSPDHSMFIQA